MTVVTHRQDTAVRYRVYGHILSCNARLHELEQTLSPDSTENTDLRIQFSSPDESIPLPSSWYLTVSLADGTPWLRYAEIVFRLPPALSQSGRLCVRHVERFDSLYSTGENAPTHPAPPALGSGPSPCAQLQRERGLAWGRGRHALWRLCIRWSDRHREIYLGGKLSVCGILRVNR